MDRGAVSLECQAGDQDSKGLNVGERYRKEMMRFPRCLETDMDIYLSLIGDFAVLYDSSVLAPYPISTEAPMICVPIPRGR